MEYKKGTLFFENADISKIAREVKTPFYAYSAASLSGSYKKIGRAFAGIDHLICYAVKSNSNLAVLNLLARIGSGADIVSGGELYRCLKAGIKPSKIVFSGVGKTEEEIEYALKSGILMFNAESAGELEAIGRVALRLKKEAPVAVRVNPDVEVDTHHHITTGKSENKFGISFPHVLESYIRAGKMRYVRIKGIQMHIGSQIKESRPYLQGVKKLLEAVACLSLIGIKIDYLDIGGGFGIAYSDSEKYFDISAFASEVKQLAGKTGMKILLEPGRFISAQSGILVARVIYVKYTANKNFIIVDAAMNDLIRPALYGAHHRILPVKKNNAETITADIVGPICESGDFLAKGRRINKLSEGDLIAVLDAGAYGFVMSSNYNSRPKAAEVLVKGAKYQIVRQREKIGDLLKTERIADL